MFLNPPESAFALGTERLILRDFIEDDAADIHAFRSDPKVTELMDVAAQSREESNAWLDSAIYHNRQRPRTSFNLAITRKDNPAAIGWIGFGDSSRYPGPQNYGVGYMINSNYWGRGFATEALRAVVAYVFGELGGNHISGWCFADNVASARVMQNAGLQLRRRFESIDPWIEGPIECLEFEIFARKQ